MKIKLTHEKLVGDWTGMVCTYVCMYDTYDYYILMISSTYIRDLTSREYVTGIVICKYVGIAAI